LFDKFSHWGPLANSGRASTSVPIPVGAIVFSPTEWITTGEAAELTGYTPSYFRKAIKRGLLKAHKRDRNWFLLKKEVEVYAKEMRTLGPDKHNPERTREHQ
jgi:excisionase family DNA binding protein